MLPYLVFRCALIFIGRHCRIRHSAPRVLRSDSGTTLNKHVARGGICVMYFASCFHWCVSLVSVISIAHPVLSSPQSGRRFIGTIGPPIWCLYAGIVLVTVNVRVFPELVQVMCNDVPSDLYSTRRCRRAVAHVRAVGDAATCPMVSSGFMLLTSGACHSRMCPCITKMKVDALHRLLRRESGSYLLYFSVRLLACGG